MSGRRSRTSASTRSPRIVRRPWAPAWAPAAAKLIQACLERLGVVRGNAIRSGHDAEQAGEREVVAGDRGEKPREAPGVGSVDDCEVGNAMLSFVAAAAGDVDVDVGRGLSAHRRRRRPEADGREDHEPGEEHDESNTCAPVHPPVGSKPNCRPIAQYGFLEIVGQRRKRSGVVERPEGDLIVGRVARALLDRGQRSAGRRAGSRTTTTGCEPGMARPLHFSRIFWVTWRR